jgi:hypothetical protein
MRNAADKAIYLFVLTANTLAYRRPSSDLFITFSLPFYHHIHPFQQGQELGVTQTAFDHSACTSRGKLSRFQTLAPQAVTTVFKRQHLNVCLPPIDKGKPVPTQRVFAELLLHPRGQAIERAAHIGRLRA